VFGAEIAQMFFNKEKGKEWRKRMINFSYTILSFL
jgi:hypothetical protein